MNTVCAVESCFQPVCARHMCSKHYQYAKYHGTLMKPGRTGKNLVSITHPLYKVWGSMKTRCDNPKSKSYERYGGKGIAYAPEWATFNNFYLDMQEGYQEGLILDRKDNLQGYSKDNCRWVTYTESNRNRSCVKVTEEVAAAIRRHYAAGSWTQQQLAVEFNLDQTTISDIIRQKSWRP